MGRLRFTLLAVLAILITASPIMAFASISDLDVDVPRLRIPVDLDGSITGDEWSDAAMLSVTFIFDDDWVPPFLAERSGTIYLKHDCEKLWIALKIEDTMENVTIWTDPSGLPEVMGDCMFIMYDVSGDGAIGPGDDEKGMLHPDMTLDVAIIPVPPNYFDMDTNLGGTKDIQGASGWSAGWITYELVHPLKSGDTLGNDPALEPGGSILASFYVEDPEFGVEILGSAGRYDLIITPCPSVGGIAWIVANAGEEGTIVQTDSISLLTPLLASLGAAIAVSTVILTYRRRENKRNPS